MRLVSGKASWLPLFIPIWIITTIPASLVFMVGFFSDDYEYIEFVSFGCLRSGR